MAFHFTPTHRACSMNVDYNVMAVQTNDEVWCYSAEEASVGNEPKLVLDVREMPRSGVIAEEGRIHYQGVPVKGWCLKRLTAILDFVPNGPGLASRELDDRTVDDDPVVDQEPDGEIVIELDPDVKPSKRQRIKAIKDVAAAKAKTKKSKPKKTLDEKLEEELAAHVDPVATEVLVAKVDEFCEAVEDPEGVDELIVAAIEEQVRHDEGYGIVPPVDPATLPHFTEVMRERRTLISEMIRILKAFGKPMTGKEIAAVVLAEGTLPHASKDLPGTVAARMHERPHIFSKTAPGTFGLVEWGLPAAPPREKRKLEPSVRLSLVEAKALVEKGPQAIDALLKLKSFVETVAP